MRPLVEQQLEPDECVDIEHARFCEASICTTDEVPNFAGIHWKCAEEQNAKECAERIKEIYEKKGELKNVSCQCHYGEEGEDFGNKKFTLQPPADPTDKVPMCKFGAINPTNKRGFAGIGVCKKDHHYCYAASCSIIVAQDELSFVVWSCAKKADDEICKELEQNVTSTLKDGKMSCECQFGARDVDLANEMMMLNQWLPLMP
ncbi:hypothetical protein niasHS_011943 [Heterodera schachtii]|uniref:Uncharacterized protein n=1 Tax=Heterodera schachtii TaxID=97005 RepID=A0ABD2INQ3_HETSC